MAKNIVLLSDGTGQSGGVGYETNVWRLYQALVHNHTQDQAQICCYDDGVGSQDLKFLRAAAGAFGWGLSRNVGDLYGFLVRHWEPGDRIYLFGFSRGAFTVRLLAALITQCGILNLNQIRSERELQHRVRAAYCAIRRSNYAPQFPERFRELYARQDTGTEQSGRAQVHFVGVWETVDAVGVPFDELREALDRIVRYGFPDRVLSSQVSYGCQALAIDDARQTFRPVLWDERLEEGPCRIEQVWFAGMHSNVGGGYPKRQLALVSLQWMIERVMALDNSELWAARPGLVFHPEALAEIGRCADVHGHLYDSRVGLGAAYRLGPRDLNELRKSYTTGEVVLHPSAIARIQQATDHYAPHTLTEFPSEVAALFGTPVQWGHWHRAMAHCRSIVILRQLLYFPTLAALCSCLYNLGRWGWPSLAGPASASAMGSAALWGGLSAVAFGLFVAWGLRLKTWQGQIANAGWSILFPQHRPRQGPDQDQGELADAERSGLLKIGARLRASFELHAAFRLARGVLVRVLAMLLGIFIWPARQLHDKWCFRGLDEDQLGRLIPLHVGEERSRVFSTRDLPLNTGFLVSPGERYRIEARNSADWFDASIPADPRGLREPAPALILWTKRLFALPRAEPFALLVRVGGDTRPLFEPDSEIGPRDFAPSVSGELQFLVNDLDLRIPILRDLFYCNNRGVAHLWIKRLA